MWELTKKELKRQDFVDNEIFDLLQRLAPEGAKIEWDIEMIAAIRDIIAAEFAARNIVSEQQFYPYQPI